MIVKIPYFLLPLLFFMIPISTFGTTACLLTLVLLWLVTGDYQKKISLFWQHPLARIFLILITGACLSLFYTQAEYKELFNGIKDILRLGCVGIYIYYFSQEASDTLKKRCIQAFVAAMILTVVLSYLKYFFHILPHKQGLTEAAVFKNHIKTNFFMTMAVYFMVDYLRARPKNVLLWLGVIVMSGNILFLSEGRMGYILFVLLSLYCCWDMAKMRGIIAMSVLSIAIFAVSQQYSLKFYERFSQIPQDIENFSVTQQVATSSVGARLNFIEVSYQLIQKKLWFGWGIGSFSQAYQSIILDQKLQTTNPHNEYLKMSVEFGVCAMMWFMYLIVSIYRQMNALTNKNQFLIRGIFAAFLIGCLANSLLMDFSEGIFITVMLSLFLGKVHEQNKIIDHRHNVQLA